MAVSMKAGGSSLPSVQQPPKGVDQGAEDAIPVWVGSGIALGALVGVAGGPIGPVLAPVGFGVGALMGKAAEELPHGELTVIGTGLGLGAFAGALTGYDMLHPPRVPDPWVKLPSRMSAIGTGVGIAAATTVGAAAVVGAGLLLNRMSDD